MKIVGLSGSLRKDSLNTLLLQAAGQMLPAGTDFEILSADLPLFNEELEGDRFPEAVNRLKQAIDEADAVIIASPEYNHGPSGVLKNAIDWASRPAFKSPLKDKPVALMSASPSPMGGVRAQDQLRLILASTLSHVYPGMAFSLPGAHSAFDSQGALQDETAIRRLKRFIDGFVSMIG